MARARATRERAISNAHQILPAGPPLWYGVVVLVIWAFYMLVRRMLDFVVGYQDLNPVTILPLLAMVPMFLSLLRTGFDRVSMPLRVLAWTWLGVFVLGFVVAIASGDALSGAFGFGDFLLPMAFALWLSTQNLDSERASGIFGTAIVWCAAVASAYALFQFAFLPPWDSAWMLNGGANGIGIAKPYELRAFSTLTAPSTYAAFTACAMLITLGRLKSNPIVYAAFFVLDGVALALTSERSCWLAFVVGVIVYLCFSPNRLRIAAGLGLILLISAAIVSVAAGSMPKVDSTIVNLSTRLSTLGDPANDQSVRDRQQQTDDALEASRERPFGLGVGLFGVAHRLRNDNDVAAPTWIDNGYLARLVELGWFGFAGYLAVTLGALAYTISRWRRCLEQRDALALAIAVQFILIILDGSHDHHSAFPGIIFWFTVALAALAKPPEEAATLKAAG
jgi:O-antigen ligase